MSSPIPFSIVVPTYNRPQRLRGCLQEIAGLDYPRDCFEVVVVDDGGSSPLDGLIGEFGNLLRVRLVTQENAGPASARNRGASVATGRCIAFTDDDCAPDPGWMRSLAHAFRMHPGHMLGGHTVNALVGNPYSRVSQDLIDFLYGYYNEVPGGACFFTSNNMAVPADTFRELGGFDESFPLSAGEDREFCDRWRATGHKMAYASDAVVKHLHSMTLRTFCRQHFHYGRGAVHFRRARLMRNAEGPSFEPLSFYTGLLRYPLRQRRGLSAIRDVVLMAVTQVANVGGFMRERLARRATARTDDPGR